MQKNHQNLTFLTWALIFASILGAAAMIFAALISNTEPQSIPATPSVLITIPASQQVTQQNTLQATVDSSRLHGSPTPSAWVVAKDGEDLLQLAGWSGCGDFEGGEFIIKSHQENYCGMQNGKTHLEVRGAWGIRVALEIGPQRSLDNYFGIGNGMTDAEGFKEIGIGLNPTQLRVSLGAGDSSYFSDSFDVSLNDGLNVIEVYNLGGRFELYVNQQKMKDILDPRNTFDTGKVYFGAYIGPPQGYLTIHALSVLVPIDQPNNVTIFTSP